MSIWGAERRPVRYNEMTANEFTYRYLQMINKPRNDFDQDVLTYPWENIHNFYRVPASMVEMDWIQWTDQA